MTSVHKCTVAMKRHLLSLSAAAAALLLGAPAFAQYGGGYGGGGYGGGGYGGGYGGGRGYGGGSHLVWPEVGIGGGESVDTTNGQLGVLQLDFGIGWEREGYPW